MKFANGLSCTLDLDAPGKRLGSVDLTVSDDAHEFSVIPIPLAVIANGAGPTVLLTGGNHGDEYEGQVILRRLLFDIAPEDIDGRLIVLPSLNYPAVLADARTSPIDGGNLNRSFPGRPDSGPTAAIAHFITTALMPRAQAGIDLHSGGRRAMFLPSGFLCTHPDPSITARSLDMAEAFGAPFTYVCRGADGPAAFDPVAQDSGMAFLSAELAGGGGVDPAATAIGHAGVLRVLHRLGVLRAPQPEAPPTRFLDGVTGASTVSAPITGVFEPFHELGAEVQAGQAAGRVWSLEELERPPVEVVFPSGGIVVVRRTGARVRRGSHVFLVAPEMSRAAVLAAEAATLRA